MVLENLSTTALLRLRLPVDVFNAVRIQTRKFPYRRPWLDLNSIEQCENDFVLLVVCCFGLLDVYRT